jgi:chaperone required for assembly of F1-ATPase
MSDWKLKRFWTAAEAVAVDGLHEVRLDGRPIRTPGKAPLRVPTAALAGAMAAEWAAQGERVDPRTMPLTRTANSAIDTVVPHHAAVADLIAAYGETDLVCYRATGPEALVARQAAGWDPLVDWAAVELRAPLILTAGVIHVPQPEASIAALRAQVHALDAFRLAAFHDLVTLSGSLVIGLAAIRKLHTRDRLWSLSRIDEDWQAELWGHDDEAAALAAAKAGSFEEAGRFLDLCEAS